MAVFKILVEVTTKIVFMDLTLCALVYTKCSEERAKGSPYLRNFSNVYVTTPCHIPEEKHGHNFVLFMYIFPLRLSGVLIPNLF